MGLKRAGYRGIDEFKMTSSENEILQNDIGATLLECNGCLYLALVQVDSFSQEGRANKMRSVRLSTYMDPLRDITVQFRICKDIETLNDDENMFKYYGTATLRTFRAHQQLVVFPKWDTDEVDRQCLVMVSNETLGTIAAQLLASNDRDAAQWIKIQDNTLNNSNLPICDELKFPGPGKLRKSKNQQRKKKKKKKKVDSEERQMLKFNELVECGNCVPERVVSDALDNDRALKAASKYCMVKDVVRHQIAHRHNSEGRMERAHGDTQRMLMCYICGLLSLSGCTPKINIPPGAAAVMEISVSCFDGVMIKDRAFNNQLTALTIYSPWINNLIICLLCAEWQWRHNMATHYCCLHPSVPVPNEFIISTFEKECATRMTPARQGEFTNADWKFMQENFREQTLKLFGTDEERQAKKDKKKEQRVKRKSRNKRKRSKEEDSE